MQPTFILQFKHSLACFGLNKFETYHSQQRRMNCAWFWFYVLIILKVRIISTTATDSSKICYNNTVLFWISKIIKWLNVFLESIRISRALFWLGVFRLNASNPNIWNAKAVISQSFQTTFRLLRRNLYRFQCFAFSRFFNIQVFILQQYHFGHWHLMCWLRANLFFFFFNFWLPKKNANDTRSHWISMSDVVSVELNDSITFGSQYTVLQ